ncbi:NAD(P)H-dependent oxidoreductase [Lentilactobacillus curieae]|uniref:NAD(P)H-dependent oxidoreductase n=1 Tax=Lentilactobacillus curieae TaxID=1138822 RepID=A0A1S6QFT6_9LACO|nr:NADPH-dependent FMN reductase [Lentilactobacillus curieae]AQW20475.1 NAD(P)H-dependent oxidoreductase [Lentilactobacillus curieae]
MNYLAIVGSNADKSTNRMLLKYMQKHFEKQANIEICEIKNFPVFDESDITNVPEPIKKMVESISSSDGVIISTPEYDHSIPAALKSVLEWLSYVSESLYKKPVMITGASHGSLGSSRAQNHLRQILDSPEISARVMPSSEFLLGHSLLAFDDNGYLSDANKVKELENDFSQFLQFSDEVNQLMKKHPVKRTGHQLWELNK